MITFTIPAFVLILFALAIVGTATGIWAVLSYKTPKHPDQTVKSK